MIKKIESYIKKMDSRKIYLIGIIIMIISGTLVIKSMNKMVSKPEVVIEPNEEKWQQKVIVKIIKDSESKNKIEKYKYCIAKDINKCEWQETKTKNFEVYENGINKVYIKGVDEAGNESKALIKEVKIDNETPVIKNIKIKEKSKNSITIETKAEDNNTTIKYYYGINEKEYEEGQEEYTYNELKEKNSYQIKVKVQDEAENEKEAIIEVKTE